jgi:hypothetical protein
MLLHLFVLSYIDEMPSDVAALEVIVEPTRADYAGLGLAAPEDAS